MLNRYLTIEEFKQYSGVFELCPDEIKGLNNIIKKVSNIIELQNETVMVNKEEKFLRYFMLPSDYSRINKELHKQKEFKFRREVERFKEQLEKNNCYTEEDKKEKIEEFKEQLYKELKIKYSSSEEDGKTTMTLEDLKELEEF